MPIIFITLKSYLHQQHHQDHPLLRDFKNASMVFKLESMAGVDKFLGLKATSSSLVMGMLFILLTVSQGKYVFFYSYCFGGRAF